MREGRAQRGGPTAVSEGRNGPAPIEEAANVGRGVYILPNLITSVGLFCGVYSLVQTMQGAYVNAALAILAALLFDVLDGRVARATKSTSRFGVEYDSLCDVVSFGLASGLLIYRWALVPWGVWGWLAVGLFVCCSALRLARFNAQAGMTSQGYFVGLPVPAAAVMLAGMVLTYNYLGRSGLPDKTMALLLVTYGLAALMVSTVPYPSFKQLELHRRQPLWLLVVLVVFLTVGYAHYQVVVLGGISLYIFGGPVVWLGRHWLGLEQPGKAQGPPGQRASG